MSLVTVTSVARRGKGKEVNQDSTRRRSARLGAGLAGIGTESAVVALGYLDLDRRVLDSKAIRQPGSHILEKVFRLMRAVGRASPSSVQEVR